MFVPVCVFTCVQVPFMRMCECTRMHKHAERSWYQESPSTAFTYHSFEAGSLNQTQSLQVQLVSQGSLLRDHLSLSCKRWNYSQVTIPMRHYVGFGESKSSPRTCTVMLRPLSSISNFAGCGALSHNGLLWGKNSVPTDVEKSTPILSIFVLVAWSLSLADF